MLDMAFRNDGRNLSYAVIHNEIAPGFKTDTGFVQRVDIKRTIANASYRWWPEGRVISWGPRVNVSRTHNYDGVLTDRENGTSLDFNFARNVVLGAGVNRDMERFGGIDFWKTRFSLNALVNTSRRISVGGVFNRGDQVRYQDQPFLGFGTNLNLFVTLRPSPRLQSQIDITTSRLDDPRTDQPVFDVKIFRAQTTYQFTNRLLLRNILERNTFERTIRANLLLTYRVNAGTAFYVGYDDRLRDGESINAQLFPQPGYERTNRAVFTKLQYLFRY
jgi:hypothetical protein